MYRKTQGFQSHPYRGGQRGSSRFNNNRQKSLDPALFVRKATVQAVELFEARHAFSDFLICDQLQLNIASRGYVTPTPIQDQAIPELLNGRDVIGTANTGTGKTAAFLIPLINKVFHHPSQKVLIVTPTRELAVQIEDDFRELAKRMNIYSVLCIGGVSIGGQIHALKRNPHFIIGTPGRLKDLEKQGRLSFASCTNIVLDEVDRMLDMGFITDVKYIVSRLPRVRHSLFFSATMPQNVQEIMRQLLNNPVTISVKSTETSANVDQDIVRTKGKQKIDVLHNLLLREGFDKVLVFGRTKWGMEKLAKVLIDRGVSVAAIHGNKNQNQRQRALDQFKRDQIQVLLATDIASRGLDIANVTHVINFDQPESYEDYIHRIGRTGRANNRGIALTFVE